MPNHNFEPVKVGLTQAAQQIQPSSKRHAEALPKHHTQSALRLAAWEMDFILLASRGQGTRVCEKF